MPSSSPPCCLFSMHPYTSAPLPLTSLAIHISRQPWRRPPSTIGTKRSHWGHGCPSLAALHAPLSAPPSAHRFALLRSAPPTRTSAPAVRRFNEKPSANQPWRLTANKPDINPLALWWVGRHHRVPCGFMGGHAHPRQLLAIRHAILRQIYVLFLCCSFLLGSSWQRLGSFCVVRPLSVRFYVAGKRRCS